jgi:hypothetical protein
MCQPTRRLPTLVGAHANAHSLGDGLRNTLISNGYKIRIVDNLDDKTTMRQRFQLVSMWHIAPSSVWLKGGAGGSSYMPRIDEVQLLRCI